MATPYSLVVLDVTDSTQDDARTAFVDRPVLVVASGQSSGRGRSGSEWLTADRALAASLCLRIDWETSSLSLIPLLAGVAGSRVLPIELKWPNDLLVGSKKVGGVLVEGAGGVVTIGMGVNLWWPNPPDGMAAVFESDPGDAVRVELAESWAAELLGMIEGGPGNWPIAEYRLRCQTLGREISWQPDGSGTAFDVEPDGGLRVRHEGGAIEVIRSGEVRHVR